jgi:hypothetical protein
MFGSPFKIVLNLKNLAKPHRQRCRLVRKSLLDLLQNLRRQLPVYTNGLDRLINLLRPARACNRRTHILIREDPSHSQCRNVRVQTLRNFHELADLILGLVPRTSPHRLHDGLDVRIVGDTEAGILRDAVDVFAREQAALKRGEDC